MFNLPGLDVEFPFYVIYMWALFRILLQNKTWQANINLLLGFSLFSPADARNFLSGIHVNAILQYMFEEIIKCEGHWDLLWGLQKIYLLNTCQL